MARHLFLGGMADWATDSGSSETSTGGLDGLHALFIPSATLQFWTQSSGGAQVTDLLDLLDTPITEVTADANGEFPQVMGPDTDPETWLMWADGSGDGSGPRRAVTATDLGDAVSAIAAAVADLSSSSGGGSGQIGGGNFIANPAFADGLTGWTATSGGTLALDTLNGLLSTANCGKVTRNGGAGTGTISAVSPRSTIAPSVYYSGSAWVRLGSLGTLTARNVTLKVNWYSATNTLLSSSTSAAALESIQGVWGSVVLPGVISPDTATKAEVQVDVAAVPEAEYHLFDGFQLEPGGQPTSFNTNFPASSLTGAMLAPASVTVRETAVGSAKTLFGASGAIPAAGTAGRLYWATDTNGLYFDNGTSWVLINASGSAALDGMYDFPFTLDPRYAQGSTAVTANNIYYFRLQGAGTINGLALRVGTTDNTKTVNLGIYTNTGSGRASKPSSRVSTVSISLTAATGDYSANFGSPVTVQHGQWVALSTDSGTATFLRAGPNAGTILTEGLSWFSSGGGPTLPSTASGSLFDFLNTPIIVGI